MWTHTIVRNVIYWFSGWLGIRIMCPSGATCLHADCCFSNSACWSRKKRTSSSSHCKLTCSRHDIAEKLLTWRWTKLTHPEEIVYVWPGRKGDACIPVWSLWVRYTSVCDFGVRRLSWFKFTSEVNGFSCLLVRSCCNCGVWWSSFKITII